MNYEEVKKLIYKSKGKYYVYILLDDDTPFYVGRGKWFRVFAHEKEAKRKPADLINNPKYKIIDNIWKANKTVNYKIFGFYKTVKESKIIEALKIRQYWKLGNLTNIQRPFYNYNEIYKLKRKEIVINNINPFKTVKNLVSNKIIHFKTKEKIISELAKISKEEIFYTKLEYQS